MSWGTGGSMWSRLTLEDGHEQAIRYGVVFGWRANRVARDAATSCTAGEAYPRSNCRSLAETDTLGLAEKACDLVSWPPTSWPMRGYPVLLPTDGAAASSSLGKALGFQMQN